MGGAYFKTKGPALLETMGTVFVFHIELPRLIKTYISCVFCLFAIPLGRVRAQAPQAQCERGRQKY